MEERKYETRAEYLQAFADRLVTVGWGKHKKEHNDDVTQEIYEFTHRNFENLKITIEIGDMGLLGMTSCDATLRGEKEEINEFVRAAGAYLDNLVNSERCVHDQVYGSWSHLLQNKFSNFLHDKYDETRDHFKILHRILKGDNEYTHVNGEQMYRSGPLVMMMYDSITFANRIGLDVGYGALRKKPTKLD